jgi:predicted transcriptional regulator
MSKAVLISIKPRWCRKILNAEKIKMFPRDKTIEVKTIEVRKTKPMKIRTPFPCLIYCTIDYDNMYYDFKRKCVLNGKVIGEFICDEIYNLWAGYTGDVGDDCMTYDEFEQYLDGKMGYGWHISDLKIYDEPKELSEFGLTRPPQSWCYVEK